MFRAKCVAAAQGNMSSAIPHYQTNVEKITAAMRESMVSRRVFFLIDSFMIGGTETQAVELARRLDPARYQVTVGCLRKEGPLTRAEYEQMRSHPVKGAAILATIPELGPVLPIIRNQNYFVRLIAMSVKSSPGNFPSAKLCSSCRHLEMIDSGESSWLSFRSWLSRFSPYSLPAPSKDSDSPSV